MRKVLVGGLGAVVLAALTLPGVAAPKSAKPLPAPRFHAPVKLTIDPGMGGYEPSIVVDRFNNVYVTAHKQNHNLVISPDARATSGLRSQSWIWTSKDGRTFSNMPGMTDLQENGLMFGDEGDIALDDRNRLYYVDTYLADNTFSRWTAHGPGKLTLDFARPMLGTGSIDDRPWIAAHGDGVVLYIGNQGDKVSYPAGVGGDGSGVGPGRYTVYMSYDAGQTFDPLGITLLESGWCRPAADHRKGSKRLFVLCTDDGGANDVNENAGEPPFDKGTLFAYVSNDDGRTWNRYAMGPYNAADSTTTYPSVSVARDGTVYALYNNAITSGPVPNTVEKSIGADNVAENRLILYSSKDGRTWQRRDVTPKAGRYHYTWLDVAPDGRLGMAYYYRPDAASDWHLYAGVARPGQRFAMTSVAPDMPVAPKDFPAPFGDFFQIAFGPDSLLNLSWTSMNADIIATGLNTDILYAKQR